MWPDRGSNSRPPEYQLDGASDWPSGPGYWKVLIYWCEPPHDKINKITCAPSEDSGQSEHIPAVWSVFTVRMKKALVLSYPLSTQRRLWSDWADAPADLSLRWAHRPFCWFCHSAAHVWLWLSLALSWISTLKSLCLHQLSFGYQNKVIGYNTTSYWMAKKHDNRQIGSLWHIPLGEI